MKVEQVKSNLLRTVRWRGDEYILIEYVYWADPVERVAHHSATLKSLRSNTTYRVRLEEVEEITL